MFGLDLTKEMEKGERCMMVIVFSRCKLSVREIAEENREEKS